MLFITKLLCLTVFWTVTALWTFFLVIPAKPGTARLAAALPVVLASFYFPVWLLDFEQDALLLVPAGGMMCLSAFKVLALSLNRGPLTFYTSSGPWMFAGVMNMPIIPIDVFKTSGGAQRNGNGTGSGNGKTEGAAAAANTNEADFQGEKPSAAAPPGKLDAGGSVRGYLRSMMLTVLVATLMFSPRLPVLVRHWLYTLCTSLYLGGFFQLQGALARRVYGFEIAPAFDSPWLSESFADFWSRRWNLTTTYLLRVLVFEPVMEGRAVKAAEDSASAQPIAAREPKGGEAPTAGEVTAPKGAAAGVAELRRRHAAPAGPQDAQTDDIPAGKEIKAAKELAGVNAAPPEARTEDKVAAVVSRPRASLLRRYVALQATFLFSAAWHILIFWYMARIIEWRWFVFFAIQAPILVAEQKLKRAWRRAGLPELPRPVAAFLTNFALIVIARPVFFGPADECGFTGRAKNALVSHGRWAASTFVGRAGRQLLASLSLAPLASPVAH